MMGLRLGSAIVLVLLPVPPDRVAAAGVAPSRQELRAERAWFKQHLLDRRPKPPQPGRTRPRSCLLEASQNYSAEAFWRKV